MLPSINYCSEVSYINKITQYIFFCVWIFCLKWDTSMLYVVMEHSLLLLYNVMWVYYDLFVQSNIDVYFDSFQCGVIMNISAVNTNAHILWTCICISVGLYWEVKFMGYRLCICSVLVNTISCPMFVTTYNPTRSAWNFQYIPKDSNPKL